MSGRCKASAAASCSARCIWIVAVRQTPAMSPVGHGEQDDVITAKPHNK
ncbi:hypothetical protein [Candidatus Kuenenia stuttgartiensis]|nr:hypothetical protein [Candidatus Kuenenia stuttgartiensis]